MSLLILLVVLAVVVYRIATPTERSRYGGVAIDTLAQLRAAAKRPRPAVDEFRAALRARSPHIVVTFVILAINAIVFFNLLFGSGAMDNPDTLLGWGASLGPRTTNGEWWRLLTSAFVHTSLFGLLVNAAVVVQLGVILERLAGRLAFSLVYIEAGICGGLGRLSSHPVEVTAGSAGAVFGLYGLLLAMIGRQLLFRRRDAGDEEKKDVRIPPVMMKRLAIIATVFVLYALASDQATGGELSALGVGLVFGLALASRDGNQQREVYRIAIAAGTVAALATAYAMPLRNLADVKPEIARLIATEDENLKAYQTALDGYKKGRTAPETLAQLVERTFMPQLHAADVRLGDLKNVPSEHRPIVADAREYIRLRSDSWRLRAAAFRMNVVPRRDLNTPTDGSWRISAEKKFRSNLAAIGNAETAERTAQAAFERLRAQKSN